MELFQYAKENMIKKRKKELQDLCGELGVEFKSGWTKGKMADSLAALISDQEALAFMLPRDAFLCLSGRVERSPLIAGVLDHFGLEGRDLNVFPELSRKSALKLVKRLAIVEALIRGQVRVCGLIPFDEIAGLVSYSLRNANGKEWRNLYSDDGRLEAETNRLIARRYGLVRVYLEGRGNAVCREDIIEPLKVSYAQEISRVEEYKKLTADELLDPALQMDSDELLKLQDILELLGTYASEVEIAKMREELYHARYKVTSGHNELDVVRGLAELAPFPGSDELVTFI